MRNKVLPGIKKLIDASPMKQRAVDYVPPPVPKPPQKEEKEKVVVPKPTKTYLRGGITEPA